MTIFGAQSTLFDYFLSNDTFKLKDFKKVFLTIGDEEVEKEIVKLALSDLEKKDIVSKFLYLNSTDTAWVLIKPLQHYEQQVTISPITAQTICGIINKECERFDDYENLCNPVSITDKDIQNILKLLLTPKEEDSMEDFE